MTLRDILEKAMKIIPNENIDLGNQGPKQARLISCGNMIYRELVEDYAPLKAEEEIFFSSNRAYFTSFSKPVKDILGVYKNHAKYDFKVYPQYVSSIADGKTVVRYTYHAEELKLNDEAILPPQFSADMIAVGVASEYLYRCGLTEEALFYKNRYDTSIINNTRKHKSIDLKVRRFL